MDRNTLLTLVWMVTTFLVLGGGTQVVRFYRSMHQAQRRAIAPPRIWVQYEHTLSEREMLEETWKTYAKRVIEACVETWLSTMGRSADLSDYRKWISDDQRLTAELGIVLTKTTPSFEAGTTILLTMRPDSEALSALDTLLSYMEYWRVVSPVVLKEREYPDYFIEEQHER